MSTVWRKAMIALGLGDDDDYDEYDPEPLQRPSAAGQPVSAVQPRSVQPVADRTASISPLPGVPSTEQGQVRFPTNAPPHDQPPVRAVSATATPPGGDAANRTPSTGVRTIVRPTAKPQVIAPRSYREGAPAVGDRFKDKQPVIMNVQGVERDVIRRLVDFASGLCYGLGGQMEKVATDVFLLTPADVEVSAEERQRLSDSGLYES
jgi:cell division inhibitor SepF